MPTPGSQTISEAPPPGLCVYLDLRGVPVLIVGGGAVANRRARLLLEAGADRVTAIAPRFAKGFPGPVRQVREMFHVEHLQGMRLVFVATDDAEVNEQVGRACAERGVWCNRSDAAEAGDVQVPLSWSQGQVRISVSTGSPMLSRALAGDLRVAAEPWVELAPVTARLREAIHNLAIPADDRRAALGDLASAAARNLIEREGEAGLYQWLAARHPGLRPLVAGGNGGDQDGPSPA